MRVHVLKQDSSTDMLGQISQCITTLVLCVFDDVGGSIAREIARPRDEGVALMLAGRDGVHADSRDDRSIAQSRLRGDDAIGDVVINGLNPS